MILGLRPVTRQRFAAPTQGADYLPIRAVPVEDTPRASIDVAPMRDWLPATPGGSDLAETIRIISWADWRTVDPATGTPPDRVIWQGRTYELRAVERLDPFEGAKRAHYQCRAVLVQPGLIEGVADDEP